MEWRPGANGAGPDYRPGPEMGAHRVRSESPKARCALFSRLRVLRDRLGRQCSTAAGQIMRGRSLIK